jgi:hypothetical protein
MLKYMLIQSDSNDAGYNVRCEIISGAELTRIYPVITAIKNGPAEHNWPEGDYCYRLDLGEPSIYELYPHIAETELNYFHERYVPINSDFNVRTITRIEIMDVSQVLKLI